MTAAQKAAAKAAATARERARAAETNARNAAAAKAAAASAPAKAPAAAPGPTTQTTTITPPRVDPFFTPDDINAMNDWLRTVGDNRATNDSTLANAKTDTSYQTGQLATQAKQSTSNATDDAIGRGVFQSSVKDAALFDIEAQRATQQGYLNDRLSQATTDHDTWVTRYGGVMSDGTKVDKGTEVANFEQGWAGKAQANAQAINDNATPYTQTTTVPAPAAAPAPAKGVNVPGVTAPTAAVKPAAPINTASGIGTTAPGANGTATNGTGPAAHASFQAVPGVDAAGHPGTWHVYSDGRPAVFVKSSGGVNTP